MIAQESVLDQIKITTKIYFMDTISFDKLLLKTAFCCMASDGHIDQREVDTIENLCRKNPLFSSFNFHEEVNQLVNKINSQGKEYISYYFSVLSGCNLTEGEELQLIDFAMQTIKADEDLHYTEIKMFKNIRHRLKLSDDVILKNFPEIEMFLEQDIIADNYLDKITSQYFDAIDLPQFNLITIDNNKMD